jgi:hydrogenase maturation factor HypF (carbamoyltransferase family)
MPDYFTVAICLGCQKYYSEEMLTNGLCDGCDSEFDQYDDDDYHSIDPNTCSDCGSDTVQVQNGDWVCPSCDLWLY